MQSCSGIENGAVEPIAVFTNRVGQTVVIRICRQSDGFFLDWSDDTFKTVAGVVTLDETLTAKDATNAPGIYELATVGHPTGLDTSLLGLSAAVDHSLLVIADVTAGPAFATTNVTPETLKVFCLVDAAISRKTVLSRVNAMAHGKVTLDPAPASCPPVEATYFDENDVALFTTSNDGGNRTIVP